MRIAAESTAIVGSILIAFAIDAWWADLSRKQDELESIELIRRDLQATKSQLVEYADYAESAAQAALNAYVALSSTGPYDRDAIRDELFRVDRRTLKIPKAACTELLSTGNLRVISSRELRGALVRMYEFVERSELIIQKNNDAFLDGLLVDVYFGEGLLLPYVRVDTRIDLLNEAYQKINERLPDGFVNQEDPLWKFDADSAEWRRMRSAVLYAALNHNVGAIQARQMTTRVDDLSGMIDEYLSE